MRFEDIRAFTYTQNNVSVDGEDYEVSTMLDASIDFVQYHRGHDVLEEPLMTVVSKDKYQAILDEWAIAKVQSQVIPEPTEAQLARKELRLLDELSIREIREWIASQPSAPQSLKDIEARAVMAKAKLV